MERAKGIEPSSLAWEAKVIPLYDARIRPTGGHSKRRSRRVQSFRPVSRRFRSDLARASLPELSPGFGAFAVSPGTACCSASFGAAFSSSPGPLSSGGLARKATTKAKRTVVFNAVVSGWHGGPFCSAAISGTIRRKPPKAASITLWIDGEPPKRRRGDCSAPHGKSGEPGGEPLRSARPPRRK